ncbi:MAG: hypothetical protein HQL32_02165 [Planctomycetes bacterium]|nr:hypothetical protein [Planctomycetota bacterium]
MDTKKSNSSIQVYSVFDRIPLNSGFFPIRLKATNYTKNPLKVPLLSKCAGNYGRSTTLENTWNMNIPPSGAYEEVLIPVINIGTYGNGMELTANTEGAHRYRGRIDLAHTPLAITRAQSSLKGASLKTKLENEISKSKSSHRVHHGSNDLAEFAVNAMIKNPDQLLGWDYFIITESELDQLGEVENEYQALAFERFLKRGGQLWVIDMDHIEGRLPARWQAVELKKELISKKPLKARYSVGLGQVCIQEKSKIQWSAMEKHKTLTQVMSNHKNPSTVIASLKKNVPAISANILGFLLLILFFALMIGPINLWFFCKGNRLKLVITTPIISLLSAIIIIAMIFILDGTGGDGARQQVRIIDPIRHQHLTQQIQLSRTGIVFSDAFKLPHENYIWPSPLDSSFYKNAREVNKIGIESGQASGGWFTSRNLQAQFLHGSTPSRERVEIKWQNNEPMVLSTLQSKCELIWVFGKGKIWRGENIIPGQEKKLVEYHINNSNDKARVQGFQNYLKELSQAGQDWFVAKSHENQGFSDTLSSMRWNDHQSIFLGPLVNRGDN